MAKTEAKKRPQRAAAGGKGKTATQKAAETLRKAVVGASVSDEQIDKFWSRHARLSADLVEANKGPSAVRKKMTALLKELKAAGIDTDGFKLARKVADLGESGSAVIGWYQRLAKQKNLPGAGMQLDLLDPSKNADQTGPAATAANGANGHTNGKSGSTNGAHGQSRTEQLRDLEENGFHQGVAAKAGGIRIPKGMEDDEGAVAALRAGYERGQKKNAAGITASKAAAVARKPISRGAARGRFN